MPKSRVQKNEIGHNGRLARRKGRVICNKFRIGGRKSGKPGHTMSNDDLLAIVERGGKSAQNARQVLAARAA